MLKEIESELTKGEKAIFLKFGASWCTPCKMMKPIVEKVKKDFESKVSFYDIDIEQHPELCEEYKVQSVPTMILLSKGKEPESKTGAVPEASLRGFINSYL